jgi:tetrahydromethanopterin S-methyltransferase subunit G
VFIFSLPTPAGVALSVVFFAGLSVCLYVGAHRVRPFQVSEETRRVAEAVATRVGVIHGIVLGMMFSNITADYLGMIEALESEASALIRLYNGMERLEDERVEPAMDELHGYLRFVVERQWPALREGRVDLGPDEELGGRVMLDTIWRVVDGIPDAAQRSELLRLLDEAEDYRNYRIFDRVGNLLPLFWYTALIGYLLTLSGFCLVPPSKGRCAAIAVYGAMVGVVLFGILAMTHPYSPAAGVSPRIFQWMLEATL